MYSQNGEHQIIAGLIGFLPVEKNPRVLVEFGASRGTDNSNLFTFGESGHPLVLIEASPARYNDLKAAIKPHPSIVGIQAKVLFSGGNGLKKKGGGREGRIDDILKANGIDIESVGVVSIDIDGDDAAVFENLGFVPQIVICEFNPTFPSDAIFRNPPGSNIGNSPLEVHRVATGLGMYLVAATETNLIFMKNEYQDRVPKLDLMESIQGLQLTRFAWGYDGTFVRFSTDGEDLTRGIYHNGWNDSFLRQPLPPVLRRFSNRGRTFRIFYFMIGVIAQPIETFKLALLYLRRP
jgi:hypothetical protein